MFLPKLTVISLFSFNTHEGAASMVPEMLIMALALVFRLENKAVKQTSCTGRPEDKIFVPHSPFNILFPLKYNQRMFNS